MKNEIATIKKYVEFIGGEIDMANWEIDFVFAFLRGENVNFHIDYNMVKRIGTIKFEGGMEIKTMNKDGVIIGSNYEEDIVFMRYEYLSDIVLVRIIEYLEKIINP